MRAPLASARIIGLCVLRWAYF